MESEFPQIADSPENIIVLTPNQHFYRAHPNNKTSIIEKQYQRAIALLEKNKDKLTELAEVLLDKEVIFKDNLEKTLKEIGSLNDQNFDTALGRTISLEQENIKKHMTENLAKKDGATAFFKAGIGFLKVKTEISRKCPFCSECLGNDAELLIEDYNKFFSEAYSSLSKKRKESELYFEKWNIIIFLEQKESELEKLGIVLSTEAERIADAVQR